MYETDLNDEQWLLVAPLVPEPSFGGRPRTTDIRRVLDAIFYVVKTGCHWRLLPSDFPPWRTVYGYFARWRDNGFLLKLHNILVKKVRRHEGKKASSTIAIIDSQSVKTGKMGGERGYDGGKKVKGRKRHIVVDSLGLLTAVKVTAANVHDSVGGQMLVRRLAKRFGAKAPRKIYADGTYGGNPFKAFVEEKLGAVMEVAANVAMKVKAFVPIKKRWLVERTFAWLGDYRRLDKDHERHTESSVAMIRLAMIRLMLRRLCFW